MSYIMQPLALLADDKIVLSWKEPLNLEKLFNLYTMYLMIFNM